MDTRFYSLEDLRIEAGIDFSEEQIISHLKHGRLKSCVRIPGDIDQRNYYFLPKSIVYTPDYFLNNYRNTISRDQIEDLVEHSFKFVEDYYEENNYVFPIEGLEYDDISPVTRCLESPYISVVDKDGKEEGINSLFLGLPPYNKVERSKIKTTKIELIYVADEINDESALLPYSHLGFCFTFQEIENQSNLFRTGKTVNLQILFPNESVKQFLTSFPDFNIQNREMRLTAQLLTYRKWLRIEQVESYDSLKLKRAELWIELGKLKEKLFENRPNMPIDPNHLSAFIAHIKKWHEGKLNDG